MAHSFAHNIRSIVCVGVTLTSALALTLVACSPASAPSSAPSTAGGDCDYVNYHHDEAKNDGGTGKCTTDCDCDGMRSCSNGQCTGTARPASSGPESCNNKDYHWNEAWNPCGSGKCASDCECDGLRTCTNGACTGTAR